LYFQILKLTIASIEKFKEEELYMKKKLLALANPLGLLIYLIYTITNRFITKLPDSISIPTFLVSVILMLIGIAYSGYCFGKKKNPFDFK
jgi:hypothetical protein